MKLHVGLRVKDVARSADFYAAFFGVEPEKLRPGYARFEVEEPGVVLGLSEDPEVRPVHAAAHHFGVRVADVEAVRAAQERLETRQLAPTEEGDAICCWARQEKIRVADPDGNEWEVYCVLDDAPPVGDDRPCCGTEGG